MTAAAVVFMTVSIAFVVGLVSWCYYKILSDPTED